MPELENVRSQVAAMGGATNDGGGGGSGGGLIGSVLGALGLGGGSDHSPNHDELEAA